MRRNRRNGHAGLEFGGSGEDSFVAVVVTKLTGALLFILLLTMVIMALLPKAVDLPSDGRSEADNAPKLAITTPAALPESIAGRPYNLALAATGGRGPLRWSVSGDLPEGLTLDSETGLFHGTPRKGTSHPAELVLHVSDDLTAASQATQLVIYQSDQPLTTPAWWKPGIPPVPWQAWLEQGFGFLLLWLVHLVGMNALGSLQRWSLGAVDPESDPERRAALRRFAVYRTTVRLASLAAVVALGGWLWNHHA